MGSHILNDRSGTFGRCLVRQFGNKQKCLAWQIGQGMLQIGNASMYMVSIIASACITLIHIKLAHSLVNNAQTCINCTHNAGPAGAIQAHIKTIIYERTY